MNSQIKKTQSWLVRGAVIISIILIFGLVGWGDKAPEWFSNWMTRQFAESNNESCHFSQGQTTMTLRLDQRKWSCWVVIPPSTDWRADADQVTSQKFWDKTTIEIGPVGPGVWSGIRHGVFQFLPQDKEIGIVTITIERQ